MLNKINNEQLKRLAMHCAGLSNVLLETILPPEQPDWKQGLAFGGLYEPFSVESLMKDKSGSGKASDMKSSFDLPPVATDWQMEERIRKEQDMNRLCGRWIIGTHRCGIEINRAGEHFVLTYLKRNGRPTDERYVLIWLDGDILYYGYGDRITVLALNTETDTLMVSPGADYTRQREEQM